MPATVLAEWFGGSATLPAGSTTAETTGVVWNRDDTQTGATPIPIPTAAATNFSWLKVVQIVITVASTNTTSISNRTVRMASALPTGLGWHWKTDTQANWGATFNQTGGSRASADTVGTNNAAAAPAGYTAITLAAVQYDNTVQSATVVGLGTALLLGTEIAVDGSYTGAPGTFTLPTLILGYDEQ